MKKKTTEVLLCVSLAVCLWGCFCMQINADDAFIVEEEAFIGGESLQERESGVAPPAHTSETSVHIPEASMPEAAEPLGKKGQVEEAAGLQEADTEQEEQVTVSRNSSASAFKIPAQRSEIQKQISEEKGKELQPPEGVYTAGSEKERGPEASAPEKKNSWWLLASGGIFFLGGCVRVIYRIKNRKKLNIRK